MELDDDEIAEFDARLAKYRAQRQQELAACRGGLIARCWRWAVGIAGLIELALSPGALGPALILAVANGTMEEVIYRGVMLAWLTRVVGPRPALVLQALTFGAAHGGADFTGSPLPVMAAKKLSRASAQKLL